LGIDLLGDVGHGTIHDHAARAAHELDVVALGPADGQRRRLVALGEAKWGTVLGVEHLSRLERAQQLIERTKNLDTGDTRLLFFSAAGFSAELRARAVADDRLLLVDLDRLYDGG
jgi:hypothetical protein